MIHEMETASVRFEGGICSAQIAIKTDRGIVGQMVTFKLSEHPELDSLLPIIDRELRTVCAKSLGQIAQKNPELKS